jgi:hypothetical protein
MSFLCVKNTHNPASNIEISIAKQPHGLLICLQGKLDSPLGLKDSDKQGGHLRRV